MKDSEHEYGFKGSLDVFDFYELKPYNFFANEISFDNSDIIIVKYQSADANEKDECKWYNSQPDMSRVTTLHAHAPYHFLNMWLLGRLMMDIMISLLLCLYDKDK